MSAPKTGTLAAGLAALGALGVFGVVWPQVSSIRALIAERSELQERIGRRDDGAAALERLQDELESQRARAAAYVTPIPEFADTASLIRAISRRLDALGMREREITTGAPTKHDMVSVMPMSVTLRGDFLSIYEAVRWIESLPRLVRVDRLKIKHEKGATSAEGLAGRVEAEILLQVFFAPASGEDDLASTLARVSEGEGPE